ncbi:hypothetical protein [Nafulsella turpanensis]|uniref:hypothetical protein n=1 Tax=Nafulsella turpanensis TaxID=1265690 RepID=UPI0015769ADB|nr:hypothetical protein [Nafulsella turpanensis]
MKGFIPLFLCMWLSTTTFAQPGLDEYKDIIDLDDKYTSIGSNMEEIQKLDLSTFWSGNESERRFGFIGSNYRRLHIKFISVIKNPVQPNEYFVYGKSKAADNICSFQGIIKIKESHYLKTLENPEGNTGVLAGEYTFYEDSKTKHSGTFQGKFVTYWYKDKEGHIRYNNLWDVSAMYNNNQFVGTWTGYDKENRMTANWGDSRIPQSGDLDVGSSEFGPNEKYHPYGWKLFADVMAGKMEWEPETWWKD